MWLHNDMLWCHINKWILCLFCRRIHFSIGNLLSNFRSQWKSCKDVTIYRYCTLFHTKVGYFYERWVMVKFYDRSWLVSISEYFPAKCHRLGLLIKLVFFFKLEVIECEGEDYQFGIWSKEMYHLCSIRLEISPERLAHSQLLLYPSSFRLCN